MGIGGVEGADYNYSMIISHESAAPDTQSRTVVPDQTKTAPKTDAGKNISFGQRKQSDQISRSSRQEEQRSIVIQEDTERTGAEKPTGRTDQRGTYDQVMAKKAMENMKNRIHSLGKEAIFDYNDDIERFTITIVDKDSKEVIKEIPSEQIQKVIEHIHTLRGMMLDEEV